MDKLQKECEEQRIAPETAIEELQLILVKPIGSMVAAGEEDVNGQGYAQSRPVDVELATTRSPTASKETHRRSVPTTIPT